MKGLRVLLSLALASVVFAFDEQCSTEQETDWTNEKLLRHEVCNKFYKCTFGVAIERECYGELWFNLETWQCDWHFNVDCSDRIVPTPAPPSTSTTPTITTPTSTTTPTTTTTTSSTTTTTTTTTPAPTTTTTTTQATTSNPGNLPNGCPVDPHIHRLLPHETDCTLFYYCVWGQLVQRECPPYHVGRMIFNPSLQVCIAPGVNSCATSFNKHLSGRLEMIGQ